MDKKIILIGEDEKDIAEMYKIALEQADFKVILAENGEIVIDKAISEQPDLVLLDINMPKKDGFQVLEDATSDRKLYDALKNTPIVMLTNYSNLEDIEYCIKRGAQDYIVKSEWNPEQIVEKVKKRLLEE